MTQLNFNFKGTTIDELFNALIPADRILELTRMYSIMYNKVVADHEQYTIPVEGDEDLLIVHRGRILKELLQLAKNEHEEAFILIAFEKIVEGVNKGIGNKLLREAIEEKFK